MLFELFPNSEDAELVRLNRQKFWQFGRVYHTGLVSKIVKLSQNDTSQLSIGPKSASPQERTICDGVAPQAPASDRTSSEYLTPKLEQLLIKFPA